MRGILVQSLVSRGVPFEVALETANEIRQRLTGKREVELSDLAKLLGELLADRYDLEAPPLPPAQEPPQVRTRRGTSSPFSKGMLAVSLQGSGLDPSDAYDVARELEARLLREKRRSIHRPALRELVSETIEHTHGARAAERYRVWRQALADGRPILLLMAGATGSGKTSIAVEVARRLEISRVVGTDSIRQIMRLMFSADLMPEIHCSSFDVYRALNLERSQGADRVIVGFREQAQKIAVGVHALLDRAIEENISMVVEGASLLPSVLDLDRYSENAHVIILVVAALQAGAHESRFRNRATTALERVADRYLEFLDEILIIQDHVLAEAEQLGLPIVDNVRLDDAVLSVTRLVISKLKKSRPLAVDDGAS
jgi:2-phosphoglycerate kinase